jgi:hypothetical protein
MEAARLALLVEHSSMLLATASPGGLLLTLNRAGHALLGPGLALPFALADALDEASARALREALAGASWEGEVVLSSSGQRVALRLQRIGAGEGAFFAVEGRGAGERREPEASQLRAVLGAIPDRLVEIDEERRFRAIHQTMAPDFIRNANEAMIGKRVDEALPAEWLRGLLPALDRAEREGGVQSFDYDLGAVGYPAEHREMRVSALERGGFVAVVRDVGSWRRAEQDLKEALARTRRYEELFRLTGALTAVVDHRGILRELNEAWEAVLGHDLGGLVGSHWADLVHEGDRRAVYRALRQAVDRGDETFEAELRLRSRGGAHRWFLWSVRWEPRDQLAYCVAHDLTVRKQAEERIGRSEEVLRQTGALAQVGGWSISSARELFWTDEMFAIHGLLPGDPPSIEQLLRLFPPTSRSRLEKELWRLLRRSAEADFELQLSLGAGEERWLRVVARSEVQDGEIQIWGATQDVTVRKRFEADLIEAREAALVAARAKSQFLANTSHEIRTPLNGVLGMTSLALGTALSAEQRSYLEAAESAGKTLARIIDDVLDFSKIDAGMLGLEQVPFSPREALESVAGSLTGDAATRGLGLGVRAAPSLPRLVRGDPLRFRQVVSNLLSNALKFTHGGEIWLGAGPDPERPGWVAVEVRDTGIGIAREKWTHIFEPFTQADGSTTRQYGGTGLGLAICKQLVTLMGGQIGVESEVGVGSTFRFTVPLPAIEGDEPARAHASSSTMPPDGAIRGLRVLVAEDNQINTLFITSLLQRLGHEVRSVPSGEAAIAAVGAGAFDLVLMDVQMPVMDGLEATRQIRAREARVGGRIPIVALTASALPGDERRCLEAGMDAHLRKPLQPAHLLAVLQQLALGEAPVAFDEAEVQARFGGSRELLVRVIQRFLENQEGMEERLTQALAQDDLEELGRACHSLRGSLGVMSARGAMQVTVDLEEAAARADRASCRLLLADLGRELGRLGTALAAAIVTGP